MTSSNQRRPSTSKSKTAKPSSSKVGRPSVTGHIYEYVTWVADKGMLNNAGDYRITITLKDLTVNETITRRGIAKMFGNSGGIWIDSLEGCKDVYFGLNYPKEKGKVIKSKNGGYTLENISNL
jgi:hypothetical protein